MRSRGSSRRVRAASSTIRRKSPACSRPSFSVRLSSYVASPSICHWRKKEVGKDDRMASDHLSKSACPPSRSIEMHDVRELVREHRAQPVRSLADEFRSRRPRGGDDDRVVRHRRREPVCQIRLIDEHYVRQRGRRNTKRAFDRAPQLLGDHGEPTGGALLTLMEVDDEVRRRERPEPVHRIERGCPGAGRAGQDHQDASENAG